MIDSFRGKYFFLSNFYKFPVTLQGITYPSGEAAFQSQKTNSREKKIELFANCLEPGLAKRRGRALPRPPGWDEALRLPAMKRVVRAKFSPHRCPDLVESLLDTGNLELVEGNTWGDQFWGCVYREGVGWVGENNLGIVLMESRAILRGIYPF